jgi:hypothetical protein
MTPVCTKLMSTLLMLQSLPQWIEECDLHNLTDVPRILVGNKCDCKEKQVVRTNAAQRFADYHNMPVSYSSVFVCIKNIPFLGGFRRNNGLWFSCWLFICKFMLDNILPHTQMVCWNNHKSLGIKWPNLPISIIYKYWYSPFCKHLMYEFLLWQIIYVYKVSNFMCKVMEI